MSRTTRNTLFILLFVAIYLCLACGAGFAVYGRLDGDLRSSRRDPATPLTVFWEAWDKIEQNFYGSLPPPRERTYGAICESLAILGDPYTVFLEPEPGGQERERLHGAYGGVGVALWRDATGNMRLSPYPDSSAQQARILEGDILLAVDERRVAGETPIGDVESWLRGEVGTVVTLTLSRPPTPSFTLAVTREEVRIPSVAWRMLDVAPTVGYIHIQSFTGQTADEVREALQELLVKSQATALVLDLRDNAGGLLDPAVATASQFVRDGVVLIEQRRGGDEQAFQVQSGGLAVDTPLVVLVNGGTASAAEIVAGALQDHHRAALIGEPTYGKGSVQLIYQLSDGSSLHVTAAIWLTPERRRIEGKGLTPDVYVPQEGGATDVQLERAVSFLQTQFH